MCSFGRPFSLGGSHASGPRSCCCCCRDCPCVGRQRLAGCPAVTSQPLAVMACVTGSERTQFLSAVLSIVELTCCQGLTPPTQPGHSSLFTTSDLSPFCGGREGHCGKEWRCGPGQGGLAVWGAAWGMAAGGSPCVQGRLASSGGCLWNKRGAWDPTDRTGFQEAELAFSELGILSSAPQSQTETGTLSATCLTPGSTNFLCFSMILMTLIALKFNYTLNDLHLLKRIQLHEVRTFLENLEHKVTIIIYFVVFKVDLFPGVTLTCQRE